MPNHLAHFAIHADDLDRARRFYAPVFGWRFDPFDPLPQSDFCKIKDTAGAAPGAFAALQHRKFNVAPSPITGFECTIGVDDLDAIAAAVAASGGRIVMPRTAVPGVGWLIKFLDSEGNLVCAMQFSPQAK